MLLSQTEIEEMKSRYPDEKPVAFNFMQAREDFIRLAEAYNAILNGSNGSALGNLPCQSDKKRFLVLINSSYVRDAQILPGDLFINEEICFSDIDSKWEDYEASMLVGQFMACCSEEAITDAADNEHINPEKLIAYQIVD